MTRGRVALLVLTGIVIVAVGAAAPALRDDPPDAPGADPPAAQSSEPRDTTVTVAGVTEHLAALAEITREHGNTRAAGTPGYRASADYVTSRLEDAGYEVATQPVTFTAFRERTASRLLVDGRRAGRNKFKVMMFSASGTVGAPVAEVDASFGGCSASDFDGFRRGDVALVTPADCPYARQASNAEAAGASALLVAPRTEDAGTGPLRGMLGEESGVTIPVVGVTYALGKRTARGRVQIRVDAVVERARARNVIAQTRSGSSDTVVMLGAHLDSALGSPGINDNGSGSAVLLEVAEVLARRDLRNGVRFGWWAAEEYGLVGSTHYVESLGESERSSIAAYLNFDMVGSPNFVRYVYEGEREPEGSVAIEEMFRAWFERKDLAVEGIALEGRSDHAAFARAGIPVGGLFTGANMLKTASEVEVFGGTPGIGEDPCYHLACDDLDNVDRKVLSEMIAAIAHAMRVMAETAGGIP